MAISGLSDTHIQALHTRKHEFNLYFPLDEFYFDNDSMKALFIEDMSEKIKDYFLKSFPNSVVNVSVGPIDDVDFEMYVINEDKHDLEVEYINDFIDSFWEEEYGDFVDEFGNYFAD
jgi:hypothetical protein